MEFKANRKVFPTKARVLTQHDDEERQSIISPLEGRIPLQEYDHMICSALEAGCDGFVLGPLYSDEHGRFVRCIPDDVLETLPSQKAVVAWSAHAPIWRRYEDEERRQRIAHAVEERGGRVFLSSVDALQFATRKEVII